ncbi:hypothetical protein ACWDAZ_34940, partial [Streptomyces sp. NPDC001215]
FPADTVRVAVPDEGGVLADGVRPDGDERNAAGSFMPVVVPPAEPNHLPEVRGLGRWLRPSGKVIQG